MAVACTLATLDRSLTQACHRRVQRADGPATVLAIGTATPPNVYYQSDYPDFYFDITNSNHMTDLKQKFKRLCERSGIRKRHMYLTEEILKANPSMCAFAEASLDVRQDMVVVEVPRLGKEAASKAMEEWGRDKSEITHLIFCTTSGVDMPGADWELMHPGGRAIVDQVEKKLELQPEKMASSRHVLSEYGNMSSACVIFVMDHVRKKSVEQKAATTGEGHEWGLLVTFGPGITCETVVLRSVRLKQAS